MTSFSKVLVRRVALSAALLALACQSDSGAEFDNSDLGNPGSGASGSGAASAGGSKAQAGTSSGAASTQGGSSADAGTGQSAGDAGSGSPMGGKGEGGSAGSASGGQAGSSAGDTAAGGMAGKAMGGMAGMGGTKPDPIPDPITLTITEFDDAYVLGCDEFQNTGSYSIVNVDANDNCPIVGLMQPSLAQLPEAALVSKAELTLNCADTGELIHVYYASDAWTEDSVRWQNRPDLGADLGVTLTCSQMGAHTVDLTAAVKAWLAGDVAAHGIYLVTQSDSGSDITSSEGAAGSRPKLTVTYTLPIK